MKVASTLFAIAVLAGSAFAASDVTGSGVVVLDPSAEGALSMVGNSTVQIPARAVYVNSNHSQAVRTTGSATLDCPHLYIVGGANFGGGSCCTGCVTQSCNGYQNPLASMSCASTSGMSHLGSKVITGGSHTLAPGYYDGGIRISGNSQVVFAPGVYLVGGDGLRVTSGAIVAEGVCIMMVGGSLNIAGCSSLSMSPPSSGMYSGMVIMQSQSNESEMSLAGGSEVNVSGTIYVPGALVNLVGNSNVQGQGPQMGDLLVSKKVRMAGTGTIKIGRPTSTAIQLPKLPLAD
jgi:hypothetical protein